MDEDRTVQTEPAAAEPTAAELTRELEQLRARERERALLDGARAALRARGLDEDFAALLRGGDEAETQANVAAFERRFQAAVGAEVRRRIPAAAPPDYGAAPAPARGRGIRRL